MIEIALTANQWLWLDRYGVILGDFMLTVTLIGGIVGIIKRNDIRQWLNRNRFPSIGGDPEHTRWQGLIFTVSRDDVPLWVINQVHPTHIGLLVTDASWDKGELIKQKVAQQTVFISTIYDPDNPEETHRKANQVIQQMKEANIHEIAIDITGGKTPMSLGAFMAAEENGCDTIYVTTEYKDRQPDMTTAKIKAISQANE
ncbi:MAG: hypothetical protein ACOYM1_10975 [Methylovulum sp.]|jgi:hypothetical protein